MSTTIDERVVEMQFDNRQFEKNITQSITSLDELKKSLDLNTVATKTSNFLKIFGGVTHAIKGGITGLGNITKSVKNFAFSLTGLNSILANNASKMTSTLAALTGGAIASGFEEYELKVNSVRTILSNVEKSGKGLGDVTEALEELNRYADKTIYNFAEMTRNIGYFTVAGVGLEESVSSIKGFMNLAALQGVDATAAARATYQLSQAMSTGSMRLMDWRSMENAGMGGKQFQEMLVEVAKASNVNYDALLKKHKSFRETLSEGWLTSDIMLKTLQLYSGDFGDDFVDAMKESTYAVEAFKKAKAGDLSLLETYGIKIEDLQDETGAWLKEETIYEKIAKGIGKTDIENRKAETIDYLVKEYGLLVQKAEEYYDLAVKANKAAKEVTTFRKLVDALSEAAQSGWSASWEIILGNVEEAKHIFTPISDEIGGILQASAEARNKILSEWKEGTVSSIEYDVDGNVVKRTFKLYDAIANFYTGVKSIAGHFKTILNSIFTPITSKTLIEKTESLLKISEGFKAFATSKEGLAKLTPVFETIGKALGKIRDVFKSVIKGGFELFFKLFTNPELISGITRVANGFTDMVGRIVNSKTISTIFSTLYRLAVPVVTMLGNGLAWVVGILRTFSTWFKSQPIGEKLSGFFGKIPGWINTAVDKLNEWSTAFKAWTKKITTTAVLSKYLKSKVTKLKNNLSQWFGGILGSMSGWFTGAVDSIAAWFSGIFGSITGWFSSIIETVKNWGIAFWNAVTSFFTMPKIQIKGFTLSNIFESIRVGFETFFNKVKTWFKDSDLFQKIGNKFSSFFTSIKDLASKITVFSKVKDALTGFWEKIVGWFGKLKGISIGKISFSSIWDSIKSSITNLPAFFSSIWASVKSTLAGFWDKIKEWFTKIKSIDIKKINFSEIWESIKSSITNLPTIFSNLWTNIKSYLSGFWEKVKGWFGKIKLIDIKKISFSTIWESLKASINRLPEKLRGAWMTVKGFLSGLWDKIRGWFDKTKKIDTKTISFSSIFESLKKSLKNFPAKFKELIGKLKPYFEKMRSKLSEFLNRIFKKGNDAISSASKKETFFDKIKSILAAYFDAAKKLWKWVFGGGDGSKGPSFIKKAFNWITTVAFPTIMNAALEVIKYFRDHPIDLAFIKVVAIFFKIYKPIKDITGAFNKIGSAFKKAAGAKNKLATAQVLKSFAKVILSFAAFLAVIVAAIAVFGNMTDDQYKQAGKGILMTAGIIAAIGVFAGIVKHFNLGTGMQKLGTGALSLMLSIIPMIVAIKLIQKYLLSMTPGELVGSIVTFIGMLAIIIVSMRIISKKETNLKMGKNTWKNVLGMMASLILVAIAIRMLAKTINKQGIWPVLGALLVVGAIMAGIWALSKYSGKRIPKGLIAMAGAITIIAASMALVSLIPWKNLKKAGAALLGIMTAITLFSRFAGEGIKAGRMIVMAAAIGVVARTLYQLSKVDSRSLQTAAISLAGVFAAMTYFSATLGKMKITDALKAVANFAILVVGILGVVAGIGYVFSKIDGLTSETAKKDGVFNTLGTTLGEFVGSIVGGFLGRSSSGLSTIADNLVDFGNHISPFLDTFLPKLDSFDTPTFSKLTEFATALGNLSGVSKLDFNLGYESGGLQANGDDPFSMITAWLSRKKSWNPVVSLKQDFDTYAKGLTALLGSMEGFMEITKEYNDTQLASINGAFTAVSTFLNGLDMSLPEAAEIKGSASGRSANGKMKRILKGLGFGYGGGDIAATIRSNFADVGKGLSDVLDASTEFMAMVAEKIPEGKLTEIQDAFGLVTGFMLSVNGLTLPEELTVEAGGAGGLGKGKGLFGVGAAFGFAKNKKTEFDKLGKGLGTILDASSRLIESSGKIAESGVSIEALKPAFDSVTGLLKAVSGLVLPEEVSNYDFTAGGLLALVSAGGGGGAFVNISSDTENTDFDSFASGVSKIIDAAGSLITTSADVVGSGISISAIKPAFDNVVALFTAISGLVLPEEVSNYSLTAGGLLALISAGGGGGGFVHISSDTENTDFDSFASGVSSILTASGEYIKASAAIIESGVNLNAIKPAFDNVVALFTAISEIKLPEQSSITIDENLGGWLSKNNTTTVNTTFDNLTRGIGRILKSVTKFVAEAAKAQGDGVDVSGALKNLAGFMESISNMETPTVNITIRDDVYGWITTQKETFDDFVQHVQSLIDMFTKYGTDMADFAKKDEEGFNVFERATNQLTGFINAINGFGTPDSADTDYFNSYTTAMNSYSSPIAEILRAIGDKENGLFAAFVNFSEQVKGFTGDEQANIGVALSDLVTFINGLNNTTLPTKLKIDWSGIEVSFDLGDLAEALPSLGTNLAAFYNNLVPAVDSLNLVYDALASGNYENESKVTGFLGSIVSMFTGLWKMGQMIGSTNENILLGNDNLKYAMGSLVDFMSTFTELLTNEELFTDDDLDVFQDFGAAIFDAIGVGFADPTALRNASAALGEALDKLFDPKYQPETGGLIESVQLLNQMIVDALNSDLTIRPVLDTSDIEAALSDFSGKEQIMNFNGTKKRVELTSDLSAAIDGQIGRVVKAVDALGPKIDAVGQSMKSIRVWIDGSVLAGYLLPTIDSGLASSANRSARGAASSKPSLNPNYSNTPSKVY